MDAADGKVRMEEFAASLKRFSKKGAAAILVVSVPGAETERTDNSDVGNDPPNNGAVEIGSQYFRNIIFAELNIRDNAAKAKNG